MKRNAALAALAALVVFAIVKMITGNAHQHYFARAMLSSVLLTAGSVWAYYRLRSMGRRGLSEIPAGFGIMTMIPALFFTVATLAYAPPS